MKRLHKLKSQAGFTLAETLLAVLILLLVSGIVATGVPVARNVYEKVVLSANAQVMLSTAVDALKSEIGTAWKVNVVDENTLTYFSSRTGWKSQMILNTKDGKEIPLRVTEYIELDDDGITFNRDTINQEEHSLVPDKSSKLYVWCERVAWSDETKGVVKFSNIQVRKKFDNSPLATLNDLEIRIISENVI